MIRKLFLIPPLGALIIAIVYIIGGNYFNFFLWLFATGILFITFWPILGTVVDVHVPMMQVFFTIVFFFLLALIVAYMDLSRAGLSIKESAGYAFVIAVAFMAGLFFLKGK